MTSVGKCLTLVVVRAGLAALALLAGWTSHAQGELSYTYTTLSPPGPTFTQALGINDVGQIVGQYTIGSVGHAFLFSGGFYTVLDQPGWTNMFASGINNAGQIVGYYAANNMDR